jgi:hypothetical protein
VSGIAAVSVIATILMARRRRRVYVVEEEGGVDWVNVGESLPLQGPLTHHPLR